MKYTKPLTLLLAALALGGCHRTPGTLLEKALDNPNYSRQNQQELGESASFFREKSTDNLAYAIFQDGEHQVEYFDLNHNGKIDRGDYFFRLNILGHADCKDSGHCLDCEDPDDCKDYECNICFEVDCFTHYPQTMTTKPLRAVTTADDRLKLYPENQIDYITSNKIQTTQEIIKCALKTAQDLQEYTPVIVDPELLP